MSIPSKTHTTNYYNTFIEIAEDTKAVCGTMPPSRGDNKSIAEMQFELISNNPYKYTSDDVFFMVFAMKKDLTEEEYSKARDEFFSKGKPCFRASPLTKNYGFGVHSDEQGRVAIYGVDTEEYGRFLNDPKIKKVKAMRSTKK